MEKKEGVDGRSRALTMKAILFKLGLKTVQRVPGTQGHVVRLGSGVMMLKMGVHRLTQRGASLAKQ